MSNKPGQQYTNGSMNQKQIDPVAPDKVSRKLYIKKR